VRGHARVSPTHRARAGGSRAHRGGSRQQGDRPPAFTQSQDDPQPRLVHLQQAAGCRSCPGNRAGARGRARGLTTCPEFFPSGKDTHHLTPGPFATDSARVADQAPIAWRTGPGCEVRRSTMNDITERLNAAALTAAPEARRALSKALADFSARIGNAARLDWQTGDVACDEAATRAAAAER